MAVINVDWLEVSNISVRRHARKAGFDLEMYDALNDDIKPVIKKEVIDSVMNDICTMWRDTDKKYDFYAVDNGVYVIALGDRIGVSYHQGVSEVVYIGRGKFSNRLRSHLQNWIFDMSISLKDISFKFYMDEVGDGRSMNAFKDLEGHMLDCFQNKFGEKPLINKVSGRMDRREHDYKGSWSRPIDNRGKTYLWQIRPTEKNTWFKQLDDE